MDKKTIGKVAMGLLGIALTVGSTIVNGRIQKEQLDETVAKKVKETLESK